MFVTKLPRKNNALRPKLAEGQLAKARIAATAARELRQQGLDPIEARKAERAARALETAEAIDRSFKAVAEKYISIHSGTWKNEKHARQWPSSLEAHVYPKIGGMHVRDVDRAGVLSALMPIWTKLPDPASRARPTVSLPVPLPRRSAQAYDRRHGRAGAGVGVRLLGGGRGAAVAGGEVGRSGIPSPDDLRMTASEPS